MPGRCATPQCAGQAVHGSPFCRKCVLGNLPHYISPKQKQEIQKAKLHFERQVAAAAQELVYTLTENLRRIYHHPPGVPLPHDPRYERGVELFSEPVPGMQDDVNRLHDFMLHEAGRRRSGQHGGAQGGGGAPQGGQASSQRRGQRSGQGTKGGVQQKKG